MFQTNLGLFVRGHRKTMGLTQLDLSIKAGIPQAVLSKIENGKISSRIPTLQSLASAFDMEFLEFMEFADRGVGPLTVGDILEFVNSFDPMKMAIEAMRFKLQIMSLLISDPVDKECVNELVQDAESYLNGDFQDAK